MASAAVASSLWRPASAASSANRACEAISRSFPMCPSEEIAAARAARCSSVSPRFAAVPSSSRIGRARILTNASNAGREAAVVR